MKTTIELEVWIGKNQEGSYFEVPFEVPESVSEMEIQYHYPRHVVTKDQKGDAYSEERNIIDLALTDWDNNHLGSSGSDRNCITISECYSSPGYAQTQMKSGQWAIIVGAYKVEEEGVKVSYQITFTMKERCLLKGDLHMHTVGSDGKLTTDEIKTRAKQNGLDFVFITDHNNYVQNETLQSTKEVVMLPGVEWTHYKGHINMLGVKKAYQGSFYANTLEEMQAKVKEASENGAIISINHPFCPNCGFKWGLDSIAFDTLEVWNGPMKAAEMAAINWWHEQLCRGEQIAIVAGSDFHRNELGRDVGFPTTYLYAWSKAPSDINQAIRGGNAFLTATPQGIKVAMECGEQIIGETVEQDNDTICQIKLYDLRSGDVIRIITDTDHKDIHIERNYHDYALKEHIKSNKFIRVEAYRPLLAGLPMQLAMISNPIYFRKKG